MVVSMKSLDCIKNSNGLKLTNLAFCNLNINFWLPDFALSLFKESFGKSITFIYDSKHWQGFMAQRLSA